MTLSRHWPSILSLLLLALVVACSDEGGPATGLENDSQPMLSVTDLTVAEGSTALFTISLSKVSAANVYFSYVTDDGTATAPGDYTYTSGRDTIAAGTVSVMIIVPTESDSETEGEETFLFKVYGVSGAGVDDSIAIATVSEDAASVISFVSQVRPLLQEHCARPTCHGGGSSSGGMALGSVSYSEVMVATGNRTQSFVPDGLVVQPGNSSLSTLYTETTSSPKFGSRMPLALPQLLSREIDLIRDWINQGAQDN